MAELVVDGDTLVLRLSRIEKLEAVHGDLSVPRRAIRGVEVLEDAHRAADLLGFKVGTRLPRVVEVASVRTGDKTVFVAVHHDTPRGVRVLLGEGPYDEWIVGCTDPESLEARLSSSRG